MKIKAFDKDLLRAIRKSKSRFISILLIVGLGCGFFAGLKSTSPDMKDTAKHYFNENNLMDIKLSSSLGVVQEDIEFIRGNYNVKGILPSFTKDLFYNYEGKNLVVRAMSYNKRIDDDSDNKLNKPVLISGRLPEKSGECVVEVKSNTPESFKIGNTITLTSPQNTDNLTEILITKDYTIVGVVTSPLYIGYNRDKTNIGSGEVSDFILVPEEDFLQNFHTEAYVTINGLDSLDPFSKEYTEKVDEIVSGIKSEYEKSVIARYKNLLNDANAKIKNANEKVETIESLTNMSYDELISMKSQIDSQVLVLEKKISDGDKDAVSSLQKAKLLQLKDQSASISLCADRVSKGLYALTDEQVKDLESAKAQIISTKEEVENMAEPSIYVSTRRNNQDFLTFAEDCEKVDALAKVFPIFFILVVALVCLTTMSRMVDEERTQIGILKALGYSDSKIISKYVVYSFVASVTGCTVGVLLGLKIFPTAIFNSYKMLYNLPYILTPFRINYFVLCLFASLLVTCGAVIFSAKSELKGNPSTLMRPKSPKAGKRVFLERVPFIWSRINFISKVTVRNLLRYKKRFLMTVVGVSGCTALMLAGFGLKNSIVSVIDLQSEEVTVYDGVVALDTSVDRGEFISSMSSYEEVEDYLEFHQNSVDVSFGDKTRSVRFTVIPDSQKLNKYIKTVNPNSKSEFMLDDNGIAISEKLSMVLGVKKGDTISIKDSNEKVVSVKISDIFINYAVHYALITDKLYEELYQEKCDKNMIFFNIVEGFDQDNLSENMLKNESVLGVSLASKNGINFKNGVKSLDYIVLILIICAGLLAVVVLYNLTNININERNRELATIKVLGFYDYEVSSYIFRENAVSSLIGTAIGLMLGVILHRFVVFTSEVDMVLFNREIELKSFIFSAMITMFFSISVNLYFHFKMKKINMVESLKAVE